jgi:hypothetical protein
VGQTNQARTENERIDGTKTTDDALDVPEVQPQMGYADSDGTEFNVSGRRA